MVLKDLVKGKIESSIKDGNWKNIDATYQKKLGIGTFEGSIDELGDGGLPYTSSICWCQSTVINGIPPFISDNTYWFVLETNIVQDGSSIRSQKATVWGQDGNRVLERLFTNGEWYPWKEYLKTDGNLKDTTVSFTSGDDLNPTGWTDFGKIVSGKIKDILNSVSIAAKNLRYMRKLIGTTDISKIGDGTLTGIVNSLNTNIQYKYIGNEITVLEGINFDAYVENGMVIIKGVVPKNISTGLREIMQVPEKYAPRIEFYGYMSYIASSSDIDKVASIIISKKGIVKAWVLFKLDYDEAFIIQYPLKRS